MVRISLKHYEYTPSKDSVTKTYKDSWENGDYHAQCFNDMPGCECYLFQRMSVSSWYGMFVFRTWFWRLSLPENNCQHLTYSVFDIFGSNNYSCKRTTVAPGIYCMFDVPRSDSYHRQRTFVRNGYAINVLLPILEGYSCQRTTVSTTDIVSM